MNVCLTFIRTNFLRLLRFRVAHIYKQVENICRHAHALAEVHANTIFQLRHLFYVKETEQIEACQNTCVKSNDKIIWFLDRNRSKSVSCLVGFQYICAVQRASTRLDSLNTESV